MRSDRTSILWHWKSYPSMTGSGLFSLEIYDPLGENAGLQVAVSQPKMLVAGFGRVLESLFLGRMIAATAISPRGPSSP